MWHPPSGCEVRMQGRSHRKRTDLVGCVGNNIRNTIVILAKEENKMACLRRDRVKAPWTWRTQTRCVWFSEVDQWWGRGNNCPKILPVQMIPPSAKFPSRTWRFRSQNSSLCASGFCLGYV
eukprot:scaffold4309_cov116-Cylindrotheca_fusiformis.AAC.2